jgi:hypothetical protein
MSGAASIAAAKNRRTKPDPNQKPIISCSTKPSGPSPPGSKLQQNSLKSAAASASASVFDEESLQITGPMPLLQVLKVHEQRLNKLDEKLAQKQAIVPLSLIAPTQQCIVEAQGCDEECYDRLQTLEEKIQMLEEVIMNLQLTLTNVQSFAMETSLAMLKLQNTQNTQTSRPVTPPAATITTPSTELTLTVEELTTPI